MSSLFRALLIVSLIVVAYLVFFAPSRLVWLKRHARRVGLAYVAAIIISAFLRLYFGWGT